MEQTELTPSCDRCGSNTLHRESVRSAFWHDDRLVVVEDIPALVCTTCQEQFYEDSTVILLDLLRGDNFPAEQANRELRVLVFSLRDRMPAEQPA